MNAMRSTAKAAAAAGLIALLGSSLNTPAQPNPENGPARRPQGGEAARRMQRPSAAGAGRFVPGVERLQAILTEDQRASLRQAMAGQQEKMRDLEEKMREARRDLLTAGLTEKFDVEEVRSKALAAAKLDAELTVLRAQAFSQMRPALSAEQLEKLKAPPAGRREDQPESPRRRPDSRRDEHGLPPKDGAATGPAPAPPSAAKPPQP